MEGILPRVLGICGVDGSGKTTQLKLMMRRLNKEGVKFKYVWLRWTAFLSYPFLAVCRLLGYTEWKTIEGSKIKYAEHNFFKNKAIAKLWAWIYTIDSFISLIIHVEIPSKLGHHILCDRHVLDIIVDLICETRDSSLLEGLPGKLLFRFLKRDLVVFLLEVDENTAFERRNDIPSRDYLRKRLALYRKLSRSLSIRALDGKGKPEEIHQTIIKHLEHIN